MMKNKLWGIYTKKNPNWLKSGVKLTPNGLKKLFEQTYDHAHAQGVKNGKVIAEKEFKEKQKNNPLSGLFG